MFEAVIAVCLPLADAPCRDQLVPGHEATRIEACAATAPPEARCVPVGETLAFTQVAPGVFVHVGIVAEPDAANRGDVSNIGFVIGAGTVAVIDSGSARWIGEATWRAIRARTDKPVSHVALTHMHPDHVFGASVFADAGAVIVAHATLPRALADRQDNYLTALERLVGPQHLIGTQPPHVIGPVSTTLDIDLGDRKLTLQAWPTAHTGGDLTALDVETGTLFAGDLVFHRHTPALDGSLRGWQAVLSDMEAMDVQRVVPGHGGPALDWPSGAADMTRYLGVLLQDTRAVLAKGIRLGEAVDIVAQSEAQHWELFDAYNPRNATVAFTELEWE